MLKYFKWSFIVTIAGIICAYFWGENIIPGSGFKTVLIALFLSILEITLSFDNAVINAVRLKKMNHLWQQLFLGIGIIIAVFGVRLLLPVLIVGIFSHHSMIDVFHMALEDVTQYSEYLHAAHTPLVTFGGIFLFMIFLTFFINAQKETCWISGVEKVISKFGNIKSFEVITGLLILCGVQHFVSPEEKLGAILSGISAIIIFLLINGICDMLENFTEKKNLLADAGKMGFMNFLYLEVIDASFSFDGLLGAFAISKDIIVIMIGLGIGAMFVRSLTIFMVEQKALDRFCFLEHGAHWAIGILAVIMLISIKTEVPEWITGLSSLFVIALAFVSSIQHKKKITKDSK